MRRSLAAAALVASSLVLASCAMPADDPNWNPDAAGETVFEEEVAAEQAAEDDALATAEAALANPTGIGVDAPLTVAPEAGALIVSVLDGSESDALMSASMAEAAETIGWTYQEVTGVDPADTFTTAPGAFDEALALNPAGIRISGAYVDAIPDGLAAAEAAGVPVICTGCSGAPSGAIRDTSLDGDAQNVEWAKLLATYVYANKGPEEDAAVEMFTLPVPALSTFGIEFIGQLATLCRECSVLEQPIDPMALADVPLFVSDTMSISLGRWALLQSGNVSSGVADALTSAILFEPTVLIGRGASAADIAALQATTPVEMPAVNAEKVEAAAAGEDAGPAAEGVEEVAGGEYSDPPSAPPAAEEIAAAETASETLATPEQAAALQAWTALPVPVLGWRVIDQFARVMGGEALAEGLLPSQLLTVANAGEAVLDESGNYIGIADYKQQFSALWGVS
jgi:hypothetical protein